MDTLKKLIELGWNAKDIAKTWEKDGHIFFRVGEKEDPTGYIVEVDPETGLSCRKGNGVGCYWTEWE